MRIIAGSLGGQTFDSPNSQKTHPMSDKIKGALFNTLGDISGLTILDIYGGSGALSYEAISRGAKLVVIIEHDKKAAVTIKKNIDKLKIKDKIRFFNGGVHTWIEENVGIKFEVIIADPPFDDLQINNLKNIFENLKKSGTFVLSWPAKDSIPILKNLEIIKIKKYGDAQLVFYREIS